MTFLSAGLLSGLLLASVPIIIHILNRRRFQVINWSPMKYLKLTLKKNRRRIRVEQMILLAMRTLAVILLILAVARPVISQGSLSKFVPGRARTSRILVLDDSLSMGYTTSGRTAFEIAQNAVKDLLHEAGTQDNLTLLTTSAPRTPLIKEASLQDAPKFTDLVSTLSPTDTPNNWTDAFDAIRTVLDSAAYANREVVLITDLRQSGWSGDVTRIANDLAAQRVPLRIIDVGNRRTENISLLKFESQDALLLPDEKIHLTATIRNATADSLSNTQATLTVDGNSRPILLPALPAGTATEVPLTITLDSPGIHLLSLSLPKDALPADDTRYLALNVRPTVTVTLVDGVPSAQPFESETDFLSLAFNVGAKPWNLQRLTEFSPRTVSSSSAELPDVLVLANVSSFTADQVNALEKVVGKGMGLIIFGGDQVDVDAYNQRLYKDGKGLLPLRIDHPADTPTAGIVIEKDPQSPLASMAKLLPAALARVRTRQYMTVHGAALGATLPEGVSILARWNNAENPPAVIEKSFGKGRVLLFTTTAGKRWTDWPLDPTYVLGVRSAALGIARSQDPGSSLSAGEEIRLPFDPGRAVIDPKITTPLSKIPDPVTAEAIPAQSPQDVATLLHYAHTWHAGFYTLSWRDEKSKPASVVVSVNPPASESDLQPLTDTQLADLLGNLKPKIQHYTTQGAGLGIPPRELWRPLATILLFLLAAEAVFAVWVGRDR